MLHEIRNAIINNAKIEIDDHGILTVWLNLDYHGMGQGFGGYVLYMPESYTHYSMRGYAGHFIYRCMQIAGVEKWSDMEGKSIRVKQDHSKVYAIGHIIKDDWFNPQEDFESDIAKQEGNKDA